MRRLRHEPVECAQQLVCRLGTQDVCLHEVERLRRLPAGEPRMVQSPLESLAVLSPVAAVFGGLAERVPDVSEAGMVVRLLEERQCLARERVELVQRVLVLQEKSGKDDAYE